MTTVQKRAMLGFVGGDLSVNWRDYGMNLCWPG